MRSSSSRPEVSRHNGTTRRKRIHKDHFRCCITIWSIGNASRGLNELIFVRTSNSTKTDIFTYFACSSLHIRPCIFQLILPTRVTICHQQSLIRMCPVCNYYLADSIYFVITVLNCTSIRTIALNYACVL